ncbi:methyltransferase domain-containing protein [Flavobacteriaceae bacterium Ap0902]|nr:methyltransferase domain-containing protein [Flavobacteriaceae bacterium Ap0902]
MKQIPKQVKDFLVSHEEFELKKSTQYDELLYTYPTPPLEKLGAYYESDDYISHEDNAQGIMNKLYYWVKQYNLKFKKDLFPVSKNKKLRTLDYGCGTGDFVQYLNRYNYDAYGLEPNPKAFALASKKNPAKIFRDSSLILKEKFDVITLYHVLEHIPNLEEEINNIINALSPDGKLFIAVPNYKSFDATYYKEYWAAYDVPRHLWHFSEKTIVGIFSQFGMVIESIYPLWFDSFYISLISEKYKRNKLGFITAPIIGLISNLKACRTGEYSSKIYQITKKN